jgi:hypothetical protein
MERLMQEAIRISRDYPEKSDEEVLELAKQVIKDEMKIKTKPGKIKKYKFIT